MVSKVKKWGCGQGLRLPKKLLKLADIAVDDDVQLIASKHQILIKKATRLEHDLRKLVARIPKNYKVSEINFGPATGSEDW